MTSDNSSASGRRAGAVGLGGHSNSLTKEVLLDPIDGALLIPSSLIFVFTNVFMFFFFFLCGNLLVAVLPFIVDIFNK